MDFSNFFACGGLFPLSFGVFTSYKSQKNRLRRCDVSFVHLYKRSVDKQKLRKLERAAGGFFCLCFGPVTSQGSAPVGELQKYGLLACSLGLNYT